MGEIKSLRLFFKFTFGNEEVDLPLFRSNEMLEDIR